MNSYEELRIRIASIQNLELFNACEQIFLDKKYEQFSQCPAALKWHHCCRGGLADHTLEVMDHALFASQQFNGKIDRDVLIAASLWHDLAKIWEYQEAPEDTGIWVNSPYKDLIYHIAGSHAEFVHVANVHGVSQSVITRVGHAILAHHGPVREWGSPVAPQTLEALLLHQADMISAKYGQTR